jgi:S-adenosylmethionine decarboxylase
LLKYRFPVTECAANPEYRVPDNGKEPTGMVVGIEWIVDAEGCRAEDLRRVEALDAVFQRMISELGLHAAGPTQWRQFPGPGGVTGLQLLTESHLTCHTYPEHATATFNLYCCRERPTWPWAERLAEMLGATRVHVRTCTRGSSDAAVSAPAQTETASRPTENPSPYPLPQRGEGKQQPFLQPTSGNSAATRLHSGEARS